MWLTEACCAAQERRIEFLVLARIATGRANALVDAWRVASRSSLGQKKPRVPRVVLRRMPSAPREQPDTNNNNVNDNNNNVVGMNENSNAAAAASAMNDLSDADVESSSEGRGDGSTSQHVLPVLRRHYDVAKTKQEWEEQPASDIQQAFAEFEEQLQKKFLLSPSAVKRMERLMGLIDVKRPQSAGSGEQHDEPPVVRHNTVRIPVVPAKYARAGESVVPLKESEIVYGNNTYINSRKLGSGTYGAAYLCRPSANNVYPDDIYQQFVAGGKPLVIKVLKGGHDAKLYPREVQILQALRGVPYALQLIDIVKVGRTHHGLVFPVRTPRSCCLGSVLTAALVFDSSQTPPTTRTRLRASAHTTCASTCARHSPLSTEPTRAALCTWISSPSTFSTTSRLANCSWAIGALCVWLAGRSL